VPLLDPKLDVVFKLLFVRNPELLRSLLEAVLGRRVLDFEILNPEIPGELSADKLIVLDLRVHLHSGERVDVEMQARTDAILANRILYYAARDYADQLRRGDDYSSLTPTVSVIWIDARLFREARFHLHFQLLEATSTVRFSDHLSIHVLQLPEISSAFADDPTPAGRALYNWGRFFAAPDERTLAQLAQEDDTMATAVKALENLSQDPETQRIARDREDSLRFYNMSLAQREREGLEQGIRLQQRKTVTELCSAFGVKLTQARLTALDDPDTDVDAIVTTLIRERRWL
jgi:predicted transposase/invertase (TIGR01784 family)